MKILVVPDQFKGSLSAPEVCQAIIEGIGRCNSRIVKFYLSRGNKKGCDQEMRAKK